MSCICQYIVNSSPSVNGIDLLSSVDFPEVPNNDPGTASSLESQNETCGSNSKDAVTDDKKISTCVSELVVCRSENWLLKKKLREYEVTIENLEHLMTTIVNRQQQVLSDMFQLRKRNHELQTECHLQREFHSMERNALLQELQELKKIANNNVSLESEDENEEENQYGDFQESDVHPSESDSDEDCHCDQGSDEDAESSLSGSPYSTDSEAESEYGKNSGEDDKESQDGEDSTGSDTESD